MIVLRPQAQREATEVFTMALALVEARGDECGILRLTDSLTITSDVVLLGKRECNNLLVSIESKTVLHAIYADDGTPPLFIEFFPDMGWKWAIRRTYEALET